MSTDAAAALAGLEVFVRGIVRQELNACGMADTPESLRLKAGKQQHELADAAGVSSSTLSRLERGRVKDLNPVVLTKVAMALGISPHTYQAAVLRVRKTA